MKEIQAEPIFAYGYVPFRMDTDENIEESLERFFSRIFTVKETGITPKRFHDWHHAGVLPFEIPQGKKNFLTLSEFIWVKLIDKLRVFGFSLEVVNELKQDLFKKEMPFSDLFNADLEKVTEKRVMQVEQLLQSLDMADKERQVALENLKDSRPGESMKDYQLSMLDLMLLHLLSTPDEIGIQVFSSGSFNLWIASSDEPRSALSHAFISISDELMVFRTSELLEKKIQKLNLLTPEEWQVIAAIRDKRAKEVSIKFVERNKERQMDLVTTREVGFDQEAANKIIELLKLGNYSELVLKTQSGGRIYTERKSRKRL